ncbi:MAG: TetR/AcrR family transcriptional regulator [Hyphomonadaceae bacterium]|nr:TetR/AcrR family transcriptional regulator [Hyphomonadaceae bacterium]
MKTAAKRGRPRAYDPEAALGAARDIFWVKGYAATSLDDIVEATGMNRPSLYAAFGDKEAIYLAALKMQGEALVAAVASAIDLDLKLKTFLDLFLGRCIDSYLAGANGPRGCFLVGTALTESLVREDVGAVVRDSFGRVEDLLEQRFKRAKKEGGLPKTADTRALAMLVSSTMHELSMLARSGETRARLQERVGFARKLIGV